LKRTSFLVLKINKYNSITDIFYLNRIKFSPSRNSKTSQTTTKPAPAVWVSRKLRPQTLEKPRPSGVSKTQTLEKISDPITFKTCCKHIRTQFSLLLRLDRSTCLHFSLQKIMIRMKNRSRKTDISSLQGS